MPSAVDVSVVPSNPVQRLGFGILLFYVFGVFSAVLDLIPLMYVLRPMLITGFVGLCIVLVTGTFTRLLKHRVTFFFLLFTGWFIACIPFSVWPGGAFQVFVSDWQKALFTFFLAAGLIGDHRQYRKVLHTLAFASILLALLALRANEMVLGRLIHAGTRYVNPNDLGMILLTAVPFIAYMAMGSDNKLRKIAAIFGMFPVLLAIAKTGSRAALIGAAVMTIIVFLESTLANKVKVLVLAVLAVMMSVIILPQDLQDRFFKVFGDEESIRTDAAIGSTYSRKMLLLDSITLTIQNPIFGVGPGMFPVAQDTLARDRGEPMGNWHVTHNTYTQVSSECGVPGMILFVAAIVWAFRCLRRVERNRTKGPEWDNLRLMSKSVRISMWSFCSIGFFASVAYLPFLPILCGLAVSLEWVSRTLIQGNVRMAMAPAPNGRQRFVPAPRPVVSRV
jgi:putative inorganic carbon (HCO3(-)) transporter